MCNTHIAYHRDIGRHWPGGTVVDYITGLGLICVAKMYVIPMENWNYKTCTPPILDSYVLDIANAHMKLWQHIANY